MQPEGEKDLKKKKKFPDENFKNTILSDFRRKNTLTP